MPIVSSLVRGFQCGLYIDDEQFESENSISDHNVNLTPNHGDASYSYQPTNHHILQSDLECIENHDPTMQQIVLGQGITCDESWV